MKRLNRDNGLWQAKLVYAVDIKINSSQRLKKLKRT